METASKHQLDAVVVNDMPQNLRMASQLLKDPKAARIFRAIDDGAGTVSGWAVARVTGIPTDEAEFLLNSLKGYGVVESTDPGLDGYYSLTKLGFDLRSGFSKAV